MDERVAIDTAPSQHSSTPLPTSIPLATEPRPLRPTVRTRGFTVPVARHDHLDSPPPAAYNSKAAANPQYHFTIAVLGKSAVGKTTLITKGFKKLRISKDETQQVVLDDKGANVSFGVRKAMVAFGSAQTIDDAVFADITILEVNLEELISRQAFFGWPSFMPFVDAIYLCYDVSEPSSYDSFPQIIGDLTEQRILTLVLACKSDLQKELQSSIVLEHVRKHAAGLVELDSLTKRGKEKMRSLVDWSVKALRKRHSSSQSPVSPGPLNQEYGWSPLDSALGSATGMRRSSYSSLPGTRRALSEELVSEPARPSLPSLTQASTDCPSEAPIHSSEQMPVEPRNSGQTNILRPLDNSEEMQKIRMYSAAVVYQSLEQLLDRLLYAAVSGKDVPFIEHFFLTYRRFAFPRDILLGFQRRLKELSGKSSPDNFAKVRICALIERWTKEYPSDFAVDGVESALKALCKTMTEAGLLYYSATFWPFLDCLHGSEDRDFEWALQPADADVGSCNAIDEYESTTSNLASENGRLSVSGQYHSPAAIISAMPQSSSADPNEVKASVRQLKDIATRLGSFTSKNIATEITRIQLNLFLDMEPRDWLHHVLVKNKEAAKRTAIQAFSTFYNHLATWVTSLILCYESPKMRTKQLCKFVEIARALRQYHNYAGLRAVTVGIMNSSSEGDRTVEQFHENYPDLHKSLSSYQKLFSSAKSYGMYRLAVKNVNGALIPDTEVHTYDIVRLQDINPDFHRREAKKIHWGKFNAIGKLIGEISQCQSKCKASGVFGQFVEQLDIRECIVNAPLMDLETQYARIQAADLTDGQAQSPPGSFKRLTSILR